MRKYRIVKETNQNGDESFIVEFVINDSPWLVCSSRNTFEEALSLVNTCKNKETIKREIVGEY